MKTNDSSAVDQYKMAQAQEKKMLQVSQESFDAALWRMEQQNAVGKIKGFDKLAKSIIDAA
ncbi:hypothetical protein ACFQUU_13775 [Herbaspirillum sp. GCM10030257]|uniref:hypothetical protein n=1 Tax=Herbaspirillum sp. GCM10030257 TaxID=3273393 RepID=UPI0036235931